MRMGIAIGAGVQLYDLRADLPCDSDLRWVRLDEERYANLRRSQLAYERRQMIVLPRNIESALRRALFATLRHQTNRVRLMAKRNGQHLFRRGHFEV